MELIHYTIAWCKGEIAEGRIIALSGIIILICCAIFSALKTRLFITNWVLPFAVIGFLYVVIGSVLYVNNHKRIDSYSLQYKNIGQQAFAQNEKKRVEEFMRWYPYTRIFLIVLIFLGVGINLYVNPKSIHPISLVLIIFALSGFVIDYYSEKRAKIYDESISRALSMV